MSKLRELIRNIDDSTELDEKVAEYVVKRVNVFKHMLKYNKRTLFPVLTVVLVCGIALGIAIVSV